MKKTDVLVIGAGLAGLSAARALKGKRDFLVVEKEARPGGLCASVRKGAFTFDYSGHLLHLRWPRTRKLILGLLAGNASELRRDARIYASGRWVPYPFQSSLGSLPPAVRAECVNGFLEARAASRRLPPVPSFRDWSLAVFGRGISRHFMLPYNAKLWQYPLDRLTADWCAPFVPVPDTAAVLAGAAGKNAKIGYNASFHYPRQGGIGALPAALARGLGDRLLTGAETAEVDLAKRVARLRGGETVSFRRLINTAPMKDFALSLRGAPATVRAAAAKLRHNSVYVLNLGVRRPGPGFHWGYFPGASFPFYRVGDSSLFGRNAPRGCASYYVEIATPGLPLDLASAEREAVKGLARCGFVRDASDIEERLWLKIPCAYVTYDRDRLAALPVIENYLRSKGAASIGRYGSWKYSFMEESVKEGLGAGEALI